MNRAVSTTFPRHHDLDALRAIAMLLGIALHGALSFTPFPWPVQDTQQNGLFGLFFFAVHGFRMPLFFVLSGFFTAMLWRRRGLKSVLWQRFRRVFLPCLAGLFTIVPAVGAAGLIAAITAPENAPAASTAQSTLADKGAVQVADAEGASQDPPTKGRANPLWGVAMLLIYVPVFHHLWFLWFLCWLVIGFCGFAAIADRWQWTGPPRWLVISPVRFLWLVALTLVPQSLMGLMVPSFGPDTSTGLLPAPHILFYYAIFFGFGVLYFDCDDTAGRVGKWWPLALPLGLFVVFPLGLDFSLGVFGLREQLADPGMFRPLAVILQVLYAWLMTFGLMGLFRTLLTRENRTLRYLSDSSYWLYVAHLPLIFLAQALVRSWPLPATLKFFFVCGSITAFLLITYQAFVRYTWLGTFLNGPRKRPQAETDVIVAELVDE